MQKNKHAAFFALLAAALYAISAPFSKLLLRQVSQAMMAAWLYLGAGLGLTIMGLLQKRTGHAGHEARLTRQELPYTVGMVVLDIAAPILLMMGLSRTTAANASLLNNFEIVATSLIALCAFHEKISRRLWAAIALVTLASALLSFEDMSSFAFSVGSALVLLAACCWGLENNCTRMLSAKDPLQIVVIKGWGSGLGSLIVAFVVGEKLPAFIWILTVLALGFIAYGLSIYFYIYAQRTLGAAKTSAYYAIAPFIGTSLSLILFCQMPDILFVAALGIMIVGTYFASTDG